MMETNSWANLSAHTVDNLTPGKKAALKPLSANSSASKHNIDQQITFKRKQIVQNGDKKTPFRETPRKKHSKSARKKPSALKSLTKARTKIKQRRASKHTPKKPSFEIYEDRPAVPECPPSPGPPPPPPQQRGKEATHAKNPFETVNREQRPQNFPITPGFGPPAQQKNSTRKQPVTFNFTSPARANSSARRSTHRSEKKRARVEHYNVINTDSREGLARQENVESAFQKIGRRAHHQHLKQAFSMLLRNAFSKTRKDRRNHDLMQRVQSTLAESQSTAQRIVQNNVLMLQEKIKSMSSRLEEETSKHSRARPREQEPMPEEEVEFHYPSMKYEAPMHVSTGKEACANSRPTNPGRSHAAAESRPTAESRQSSKYYNALDVFESVMDNKEFVSEEDQNLVMENLKSVLNATGLNSVEKTRRPNTPLCGFDLPEDKEILLEAMNVASIRSKILKQSSESKIIRWKFRYSKPNSKSTEEDTTNPTMSTAVVIQNEPSKK